MAAEWDDPDMLRRLYHEEKLSQYAIAERYGITRKKVQHRMEKYGIEPRSRGEAMRLHFQSNVCISPHRGGRDRLVVYEYGEQYSWPLGFIICLSEYELDEVAGKDIHHKNGEPLDDRPSNLVPIDHGEHSKLHARRRREDGRFA